MINRIIDWFKMHEKTTLFILVLLFLATRLGGAGLPLHQDEYKWPIVVNPANIGSTIPHPPLGQFIYRTAGSMIGFNTHFRFVPVFFGLLNLLLLYYLMRFLFGRKEALIASFIWIFSYFSVLASLMVDTDGEIMPFFFLLALIGYFKIKKTTGKEKYKWLILLGLACILGFLVKVSFLLAIFAIIADFIWSKKNDISKKDILRYIVRLGFFLGLLTVLLVFSVKFFPFFKLEESISYWGRFLIDFSSRSWFQTVIQCIKALLYSSPFLVLVPLLDLKGIFYKAKLFIFFLLFSIVFYVILFDFSAGALDRYLQLLVLPLTVLTTLVIAQIVRTKDRRTKEFFLFGLIIGLILILLQSLPHYVPSLHPKSEWITRIASLKWNFVYPFSGGSGPLGFYVSFLVIGFSWIISLVAVVFAMIKPQYKKLVLIFLLPLGLVYNGLFVEEYLVGHWNGHAQFLLYPAVEYIKNNPDIDKIITFNDNGGHEIRGIGKYGRRLYIDPKFPGQIDYMNQNKAYYFVLDVPRIDQRSVYRKYFDTCKVLYTEVDKKMSATVYDCHGIPDISVY